MPCRRSCVVMLAPSTEASTLACICVVSPPPKGASEITMLKAMTNRPAARIHLMIVRRPLVNDLNIATLHTTRNHNIILEVAAVLQRRVAPPFRATHPFRAYPERSEGAVHAG